MALLVHFLECHIHVYTELKFVCKSHVNKFEAVQPRGSSTDPEQVRAANYRAIVYMRTNKNP